MKLSLHLNGREVSFSTEELISKMKQLEELEKHFSTEENLKTVYEIAQKPEEDKYFKVNPTRINQTIFMKKRTDFMQEWTRGAILKALAEMRKKPEKYAKPFVTFIPKKIGDLKQ